jgi:spore coat protein U-like protein
MHKTRTLLLFLAGSLFLAPAAFADTDADNLEVTASVVNTCQITGGTLNFGAYDTVSGAAVNASTTVSVECTEGATAIITLGQGANPDTGTTTAVPLRRMSDGGTNYLSYFLYSDTDRLTVWGETPVTGKSYTATSAAPANLTVFGTIAANQDEPANSYSDTVVATITF